VPSTDNFVRQFKAGGPHFPCSRARCPRSGANTRRMGPAVPATFALAMPSLSWDASDEFGLKA